MVGTPFIDLQGITKQFDGLRALAGIDLSVSAGEVVALVGHNGAGKSVLVQILSGVFPQSSGTIRIDGKDVAFASPADARGYAIETIYQTLALADNLDAAANFFLGRELKTPLGFLDKKRMAGETARAIAALNPNFTDIARSVRQMSGGQRQAIAIARAVHFRARLLIMDEPTAALGAHETAQVGALIRRLRDQGIAILLVSHDVRGILGLADRIVVLKNGSLVGSLAASAATEDEVVDMIIRGRKNGDGA